MSKFLATLGQRDASASAAAASAKSSEGAVPDYEDGVVMTSSDDGSHVGKLKPFFFGRILSKTDGDAYRKFGRRP